MSVTTVYSEQPTAKGTLVTLPNGSRMYYDDDQHSYYLCREGGERGKRLPSVSSLVKPFDFDPGLLMNWAAKTNLEGVAFMVRQLEEGLPYFPEWLIEADVMWEELKQRKLTYNDLRDAKAKTGTATHLLFEGLCKGQSPADVDVEGFPEEEQGYARALLDWWARTDPTPVHAECFVLSEEHNYAGRFDFRGTVGPFTHSDPVLIDLKTSKYIGASYMVQLAGYELAARECGLGETERQMVLQVKPDGTWTEIESTATAEDFVNALNVYRRAAEIKKTTRPRK